MRESLFRGKDEGTDDWVEGYYYESQKPSDFGGERRYYIFDDKTISKYNVLPETVGQYTGLKDKNGKKIFEGDIVHAEICEGNYQGFRFPIGEVVFENSSFCIKDYKQTTPLSSYSPRVQFEVIGNIHDNPDLLKGEQE